MKARFAVLFCTCAFLSAFPAAADDALLCLRETARIEKKEGIQKHLLSAISLVETGRYRKEYPTGVAWPWTVRTAEKGSYFDTKREAMDFVNELRKKGEESIDVGCMQINLKFHPDAFKDLDEAFDPAKNIAYAVKFLKRNYKETNSWGAAATQYHSKNSEKAMKYEDLLLSAWKRLNKHGNPAVADMKAVREKRAGEMKRENEIRREKIGREKEIAKRKKEREKSKTLADIQDSKRRSAEWRKQKIEEYMSRRRAAVSEEPVFEDVAAKSDEK